MQVRLIHDIITNISSLYSVDGVLEKRDQNRGPGISVCSDDKAILVTDDRTQARNINYAED